MRSTRFIGCRTSLKTAGETDKGEFYIWLKLWFWTVKPLTRLQREKWWNAPSSVVKELVENACDAGATAVTVEIKDGGTSFIRVTDNGSGIEKAQIRKAFLRHATSKIRGVEDLSRIHSLGFRGEALSSICAVSMVELITRTKGFLSWRSLLHRRRAGSGFFGNRCAGGYDDPCPRFVL